jgi:hypothetical protein
VTESPSTTVNVPEPIPVRWEDWQWPDWVPEPVQAVVRAHWVPRGPAWWLANAKLHHAPTLGEQVEVARFYGLRTDAWGRYIHCRSNIGRVVHENGAVSMVYVLNNAVTFVKAMGDNTPGRR